MRKLHVECKPDEQLLKSLGLPQKIIQHHNDKGRVCRQLQKSEDTIGMVDEDPDSAQPTYLRNLKSGDYKHGIRILTDETRNNKIIVLCPRLEDWIIQVCKDQKIELKGLDSEPNKLHKSINFKLDSFDKLIKALKDAKAGQIHYLMGLLKG